MRVIRAAVGSALTAFLLDVSPSGAAPVADPVISEVVAAASATVGAVRESQPSPVAVLDQLVVAPFDQVAARAYDVKAWPHWKDIEGDGCDAREQALIAQSLTFAQVDLVGCNVVSGDWLSPYEGGRFENPSDVDVDHIVALANAAGSGTASWTLEQRTRFANDPAELLVVSDNENQSKGDRAPDVRRPGRCSRAVPRWCDGATVLFRGELHTPRAWCVYATRWVTVKATYRLLITTGERVALRDMLAICPR